MKELVELIIRSLVDDPSQVQINETSGESIMIFEITVATDDIGKVIGKEGRIANAIRTVVKAAGAKQEKKVTVEIITSPSEKPHHTTG
ncbi:MAG: KH domain-containing protein [Candidatus Margulisbacteria bacterium]|nr:KH domain-containing protein [Candidatus Margulisiibacteriota bacterium]